MTEPPPRSPAPASPGFTLTEVLIGAAISSMILVTVLGVCIDLMSSDRALGAQEENEREINQAIAYISNDLRNAVYIYPDLSRVRDGLPSTILSSGREPVLVFWKLSPAYGNTSQEATINGFNCQNFSDTFKRTDCLMLQQLRNSYSLVVYLSDTSSSDTYSGRARIRRYELQKFTSSNLASLSVSSGYVDPVLLGVGSLSLWPYMSTDGGTTLTNCQLSSCKGRSAAGTATATLSSQAPVLIDFLDRPGATAFSETAANPRNRLPSCPSGYIRIPASSSSFTSFFACIRNATPSEPQDAILYLRTLPDGRSGIHISSGSSDETRLASIRVTRIAKMGSNSDATTN